MKVDNILITANGFVKVESCFYSVEDVINRQEYHFSQGENMLFGEIDSGIFGISYLIGMNKIKNATLFDPIVRINREQSSLNEIHKLSCYIDTLYYLFSSQKSVEKLISEGLKKTKNPMSCEQIVELFKLDSQRIPRPVKACGNEKYRAMAAIGYSFGKQIFCFPWFSSVRYKHLYRHIKYASKVLSSLGCVVIIPTEKDIQEEDEVGPFC